MRALLLAALALSLLLVLPFALFAEDDDDGGGSVFDEPKPEEEIDPGKLEPQPMTYSFKDYRLEMDTEDGRWWAELPISAEDKEKGVVLAMNFKLPKSPDHFDVRMFCQAWAHNVNLTFNDGSQISAGSAGRLIEKFFEGDLESWKETKDIQKPKKTRLSRDVKSGYKYELTGISGGTFPLHKVAWCFTFKDKTYMLSILFTTTSYKNERITDEVDSMLKTLREKKSRQR